MWIATRDGFYSAVQHRDDSSMILVRARARDDLERLVATINKTGLSEPGMDIETDPRADYRYRVVVTRASWCMWLMGQGTPDNLDYDTNVKNTIDRPSGAYEADRHDMYMHFWDAAWDFQNGRERAARRTEIVSAAEDADGDVDSQVDRAEWSAEKQAEYDEFWEKVDTRDW